MPITPALRKCGPKGILGYIHSDFKVNLNYAVDTDLGGLAVQEEQLPPMQGKGK